MPETIRSLTQKIAHELRSTIRPLDQRWFEAELLVGHVLGQDRTWVALHTDTPLSDRETKAILRLALRRAAHEPLAYLLAQAPFCGHSFFVNKQVLIPRTESEWLVQEAARRIEHAKEWAAWDVGTGSGCLAISLAHTFPRLPILGSDLSRRALTISKKNADQLHTSNVTFVHGSLLAPAVKRWFVKHQEKHWLILANLPYLPEHDRATLQTQVRDYEPSNALFAKESGLALIMQLLRQLQRFLNGRAGDVILLEQDPRQARQLLREAKKLFPHANITSVKDINGANRFTVLQV